MKEDAPLPPGFSLNSEEQMAKLRAAALAVWEHLAGSVPAVALVFAMPDGTVTVAMAGDADDPQPFARLLAAGPEVLRLSIERFLAGKGETRAVRTHDRRR